MEKPEAAVLADEDLEPEERVGACFISKEVVKKFTKTTGVNRNAICH